MKSVVVFISFFLGCGSPNIQGKLRYFERLTTPDIVSRTRRNVEGRRVNKKEVSFQAFGRRFDLVLFPGTPVIAPDLKATSVDGHGRHSKFSVNHDDYFTGYLANDKSVTVGAHFEDGLLCASIHFANDTYTVEPAWRHLPKQNTKSMIIYRASDIIWDEEYRTGTLFPDPIKLKELFVREDILNSTLNQGIETEFISRQKRSRSEKKICPLLIVVDYDFYRIVGKTRHNTLQYITGMLHNINLRFKRANWDSKMMTGYGITMAKITIHTAYTDVNGHYNQQGVNWTDKKLEAFYQNPPDPLEDYCLGHLYTAFAFSSKLLGLAVQADSGGNAAGGICSRGIVLNVMHYLLTGRLIYPRAGFSTALDPFGNVILQTMQEVVTGHEICHNWGASHDPNTAECAPTSQAGGKYMMWAHASRGVDPNNAIFSPCTKREVAAVLKVKSDLCFIADVPPPVTTSMPATTRPSITTLTPGRDGGTSQAGHEDTVASCGNALLDPGEQCDVGLALAGENDPCCTSTCTLKPNAQCSDVNYGCCVNCRMAAQGTRCSEELHIACREAAICDGASLECPEAPAVKDNTTCMDRGTCLGGRCLSFCETLGMSWDGLLESCMCDQDNIASCRFCCRPTVDVQENEVSTCQPTEFVLDDGRPCIVGFCEAGLCVAVQANLIMRFFSPFWSGKCHSVAEFFKSNIVTTILFLTMIVYVPASVYISRRDRRNEENVQALLALPVGAKQLSPSSSS